MADVGTKKMKNQTWQAIVELVDRDGNVTKAFDGHTRFHSIATAPTRELALEWIAHSRKRDALRAACGHSVPGRGNMYVVQVAPPATATLDALPAGAELVPPHVTPSE